MNFAGMRVIESVYLEEYGPPTLVRRTWRERLFSRPWRPWKATKVVRQKVPYSGGLKLDDHTIVMHPATYAKLRNLDALDKSPCPGEEKIAAYVERRLNAIETLGMEAHMKECGRCSYLVSGVKHTLSILQAFDRR
jgi:hypothetical protein